MPIEFSPEYRQALEQLERELLADGKMEDAIRVAEMLHWVAHGQALWRAIGEAQ